MPKRPLVNISNVTSHQNIAKPTKRSLQNSPQKALKKKPKQTNDRIINDHRDENDFVDATNETKNHLINDPTKSIEKKIRAIVIGTETTQDNNDELVSMDNDSLCESETTALCDIDFSNPLTYYEGLKNLPDNVEDFDKSQIKSVESEPHYSQDIFQYYKSKESDCATLKYLQSQPVLSKGMRAVLVDWMVEVQESFELNHETLYLAVKLVDQYLMREKISKSDFQLVGATAIFIASKFDVRSFCEILSIHLSNLSFQERIPPAIEDFLYICDDAYSRRDIIMMEMKILKVIDFFLGYPISYRFLRRYARVTLISILLQLID